MLKTIKDDIWNFHPKGWSILVPTNGWVNKDGQAVMGKGIALQAKKLFKGFEYQFARLLTKHGNNLFYFEKPKLVTFPVKHSWKDKADFKLIESSCRQLVTLLKLNPELKVVMPKVGCGNGKRNWEDVAPIVNGILKDFEDRILIVDNGQGDSRYYRGKNKHNIIGEPEEDGKERIIDYTDLRGPASGTKLD